MHSNIINLANANGIGLKIHLNSNFQNLKLNAKLNETILYPQTKDHKICVKIVYVNLSDRLSSIYLARVNESFVDE
jgi:hypothetical protein